MITSQDIREKTFEKEKFGGYSMAAVDDFLEELADDVTATQKENTVLKSKMKVLVDKIEEYRANEETLNMAILSAQKLAVQIEGDARTRANAVLADAEKQAKARLGGLDEEVENEQKRLIQAQAATEKFLSGIRAMCNAQLKNLENISTGLFTKPGAAEAAPAETVDEAVRSIESSVSRIQPEPEVKIDISPAMDAPSAPKKKLSDTQPFSI